jgi:hypothetical protein
LGGESILSEFQLGLIGTCATLRCELEKLEGRLSVGDAIDLDMFGRLAGHYRRICETLGIERCKRDITPTFDALAAQIDADGAERRARELAADAEADDAASAGELAT